MVLTAAQTQAFFEQPAQMGIPHATVVQLQVEGIAAVSNLADFDKESLQQLADNLRKPAGRIPDPNPAAAPGATIPTPPFIFGAKSQHRLSVACEIVRYYNTTNRELTASNLRWSHVISNFEVQWKALKARKDDDAPEVPKISKALPIIKWSEAFHDFLNRVIGVRTIPLAYVTRATVAVPAVAPDLLTGKPHSEDHGSVEGELVARASHTHELYRDDNAAVYYHLEEATRGTVYAASIKPFQRGKDGRGAWLALTNQYAGKDKWEAELKRQDDLLHTRIWKGQSNFPLEGFIGQHRNAFVSMQQCAAHVEYQLPNSHTRVGNLLEGIQCSDAGLQAAMASIRTDDGPTGMRNDFEKAAAHLLPYDPVAKRRATSTNKRGAAQISAVEGNESPDEDHAQVSSAATTKKRKPSIGKTGVHLRYHTPEEYRGLSKEQKDELREWRKKNPPPKKEADGSSNNTRFKPTKKQIAAVIAKELKKMVNKESKQTEDEANIASLVQAAVAQQLEEAKPSVSDPSTKPKVTLRSILKQAKA